MLDLSKYANDKDSYISKVAISSDYKKYKVIYASGREEESDFSIHNYQVALYRMEEQYKQYSGEYKREVSGEFFKELKSSLIWSVIDIVGIVFQCNLDTPMWSKIIFILMFCLAIVSNFMKVSSKMAECKYKMNKALIVESYLANKENFAMDVKNERGGDEKWYVVDVNDLENFNSEFELMLASIPLQMPGFKEDMASKGLIKLGGMKISEERAK